MIALPLWQTCRRCTYFPQCTTPFAADGICPHPEHQQPGPEHLLQYQPRNSRLYAQLLQSDTRAASIFLSWRRGRIPIDTDFLHLRELTFSEEHFQNGDAPLWLLMDVLSAALLRITLAYAHYYKGLSPDQDLRSPSAQAITGPIMGQVKALMGAAIMVFHQKNAEQGSEWTRFVIDQIRIGLWDYLGCEHLNLSKKNQQEFQTVFEAEWQALLNYHDHFYSFLVFPRLSLPDMARYQQLRCGKPSIRRAISTYLTHQATEYPHLHKPWCANLTEVAFEGHIRDSYKPLIKSPATQTLGRLLVENHNRRRIRHDLIQELWQQFEKARDDYDFYWDYDKKQRPHCGEVAFAFLARPLVKCFSLGAVHDRLRLSPFHSAGDLIIVIRSIVGRIW